MWPWLLVLTAARLRVSQTDLVPVVLVHNLAIAAMVHDVLDRGWLENSGLVVVVVGWIPFLGCPSSSYYTLLLLLLSTCTPLQESPQFV